MNEKVLVKTIQNLSQEIAQLMIDKNVNLSELTFLREENEQLKQRVLELEANQKTEENE